MRLDNLLVQKNLATTRSKAEDAIRSGYVEVNGKVITKPGYEAKLTDHVKADLHGYVSRAALKLVGANQKFKVNFSGKTVLDIGSSTGGFTQYSLKQGAKKVIAIDVGTNQMDPELAMDPRVELHEKTDVRDIELVGKLKSSESQVLISKPDIIVCDVSFISLKVIVPKLLSLSSSSTRLLLMCKPQFEAGKDQVNKGVIKNEAIRRAILYDFENWLKTKCVVLDKIDSSTPGEKGNIERFYLVKII